MKAHLISQLNKSWSAITFGCWQLAPSEGWGNMCSTNDADWVVREALDQGITAFDTAEGYGDGESERRLGKALGSNKDNVIIISKIWPDAQLNHESFLKRLDQTLLALKRDYVDVYLLHWPEYLGTHESVQTLVDCMRYLQSTKKAHSIGISNFQLNHLKKIGTENLSSFFVNQVPYSLLESEYAGETAEYCRKANVSYMAYSPTAKGLLARDLHENELQFRARSSDIIYSPALYPQAKKVFQCVKDIAKKKNCLPVQVTLAWVLQQPNMLTAIVGSRKPGQITEAAQAAVITLSPEELKLLNDVSQKFHQQKQTYAASLEV